MQFRWPFNVSTGLPGDETTPWTNGNPALGIEGSIPPAEALNDPQAEIAHAIDFFLGDGSFGSGQDAGDLEQLRKAIQQSVKGEVRTFRHLDDSNVTVPFAAGLSIATAPVTHTFVYNKAFPGRATQVRGFWAANVTINNLGSTQAFVALGLTNTAGALQFSNDPVIGGFTNSGPFITTVASCFSFALGSAEASRTLQLRCHFTAATTGTGGSAVVDDLSLFLTETTDD